MSESIKRPLASRFVSCFFSIKTFIIIGIVSIFFAARLYREFLSHDRLESYVDELIKAMNYRELNGGSSSYLLGDADSKKLVQISNSFLHLWNNYKKRAWGHDILSDTDNYVDYSGYCESMIASIGTLYLMDMHQEVRDIEKYLNKTLLVPRGSIKRSRFVGQIAGGLISAYELTGIQTFKTQFISLSNKFPNAHNVYDYLVINNSAFSPSKNPLFNIHEFSSILLPYSKFFEYVKNKGFLTNSLGIIDEIFQYESKHGLHYDYFDSIEHKDSPGYVSYDRNGYSFYDALIKLNVLWRDSFPTIGKRISEARRIISNNFIEYRDQSAFLIRYFHDRKDFNISLDSHLFASSLRYSTDTPPEEIYYYGNISNYLVKGMLDTLKLNENGIPLNGVTLGEKLEPHANQYFMEHRILESLLVMYRITHDSKYRDVAWKIFQAVDNSCKTEYGYCGISITRENEVEKIHGEVDPLIFSGFFKLMYLIFSDSTIVDLDSWVITPEGHPLRVMAEPNPYVGSTTFGDTSRSFLFS